MNDPVKDERIQTQFSISYDAEGDLAKHEIDAKSLGNAILGMDDLIKSAARIVSNGSSDATLKVLAPAQEGSLEVVFAILADPQTTKAIMAGVGIVASGLVVGAATAITVIERLKDRKIDRITVDVETKIATLEVGDERIEAPEAVAKLVSDKLVRESLNRVIKAPVKNLKGAKVKFLGADDSIMLEIEPENIVHFEPLKTGSLEEETITVTEVVVRFTALNFKGKSGWRIQTREGLECGVSIADDVFMKKVSANEEAFQKDKLYSVELEHKHVASPGRSRNDYTIKRVINEFTPD